MLWKNGCMLPDFPNKSRINQIDKKNTYTRILASITRMMSEIRLHLTDGCARSPFCPKEYTYMYVYTGTTTVRLDAIIVNAKRRRQMREEGNHCILGIAHREHEPCRQRQAIGWLYGS